MIRRTDAGLRASFEREPTFLDTPNDGAFEVRLKKKSGAFPMLKILVILTKYDQV